MGEGDGGGVLAGRVAVITGAGRGLGREHALLFAREGAKVVVNDTGVAVDGSPGDGPDRGPGSPAQAVADEIVAGGGEAVVNADDVSDWAGGRRLIECAVETFGALHVLVNNAGILRDRFIVNMSAEEWDDVVRVHMRGHFVPLRWAAAWWRDQSKAGRPVAASVVNTTSTSGLLGNPGQANYGAAKAGIASLTTIAASELARYGVRVNAVAPMARTRITESTPGLAEVVAPPTPDADADVFDAWHPANVSPVVAWLGTESCRVTGELFYVHGPTVARFLPWTMADPVEAPSRGRWTIAELQAALTPGSGPGPL